MTRYVGLDVHKRFIEYCIVDAAGKRLARGRTTCFAAALEGFATTVLEPTDQVALEASTNTWAVAAILRPHVACVVVSNPLRTKAIAEAKVKTDKVDAHVLAQLLRCDYLPTVWQPDQDTEQLRRLTTQHATLITERGRVKNRIQSRIARLLLAPPCKVLWTKAGLAWLCELPLPIDERLSLDGDLRLLTSIEQELAAIDKLTATKAHQDVRIQLLMTLPGVNFVGAVGLLAALGDITRFKDGDHAAAYLGLTPSTHQSGSHCYHGHITKAGSNHARWLLTQGVQHMARHPGPLGVFFRRLAKRRNRNVAIVATARKLVTIAFLMLKHNEPYRYAKPELMRRKFRELHYSATGERLPRQRSKRPQGLNEIYRAVGLPPVSSLHEVACGELRMLEKRKLTDWVDQIHSPPPSTG
jgi:transposase